LNITRASDAGAGSFAQTGGPKSGGIGRVVASLVLIIILFGAFLGYYYSTSQQQLSDRAGTISSQSSTIAQQVASIASQSSTIQGQASQIQNQSSKISSLTATIATDDQKITTLNSNLNQATNQLNQAQSQIATLNSQIVADNGRIAALTAGYSKANGTITALKNNVTALQSQVATLSTQVGVLQTEISNLNSQITPLQNQVKQLTAELNLSVVTTITTLQTYQIPAGDSSGPGSTLLANFTAPYSGYIEANAMQVSDIGNVGIGIVLKFSPSVHSIYLGDQYQWSFNTPPDSEVIPITAGVVALYLLNYDSTAQTATVSVTYFG